MKNREMICSQQLHCLSCPLSVRFTGKDCRELTPDAIESIVAAARKRESENGGVYHD